MTLLDLLEIALLVTALFITIASSIRLTIRVYQVQSVLLALVTSVTAFSKLQEGGEGDRLTIGLILLIFLLPIGLALLIKLLLARASIARPSGKLRLTPSERREAERAWLKHEAAVDVRLRDVFAFICLVALAILIAFQITAGAEFDVSERIGLTVSLVLYLTGLYNMIVKRDIVSQVVGLLVMDHGLYLAVVKIVAIPVPAAFFVVGLYFYTLITIFILVFLLPQIRHLTGSIDLDTITARSELEG